MTVSYRHNFMALFKNGGKWTILAAAALTAFSMTGCGAVKMAFPADTYTIERQDLTNSINVSGTVKGNDLVKISSTVSSRISTLNVELGDYVKKGDILCTFDSSLLQEEYDNLKKSLDLSAEMNVNTHEINLRNLKNAKSEKESAVAQAQRAINEAQNARDRAYSRYNTLDQSCQDAAAVRDDLYNQVTNCEDNNFDMLYEAYEEAAANCRSLEAERDEFYDQLGSYDSAVQSARDAYNSTVKSCDAAIQSCQDIIDAEKYSAGDSSTTSQLDKIQEQIDNCVITAPMDGIITALNVAEGSIPTTDALMVIEDDSALKISTNVREADILKIKNGMKAVVKTTATKDTEFIGEVTKVVNIYTEGGMNSYYEQTEGGYTVEITVKESENLFIGMNAKVEIIIDEKDDVIAVPYDSITEDDDGNSIVYVARPKEGETYTAEPVKVTPAMETDYFVEIESADIKEGDMIVITSEYMKKDAEFIVRTGGLSDDE